MLFWFVVRTLVLSSNLEGLKSSLRTNVILVCSEDFSPFLEFRVYTQQVYGLGVGTVSPANGVQLPPSPEVIAQVLVFSIPS